ncbi:hypothetical protein U14_05119 [Candidatus Moduliflexus flocculans]|uniref:Rubrerythrin family protein n=1 Tax=Candidatus Moduliflexus flocculans TaxID=1499966 RepID=A0A081BR14_9BACT|nr:hypothetical protein U14_05119 [Candidatus Moduliflexus flocculans]
MDELMRQQLLRYQRNEITEYHIYTQLALTMTSPENAAVLRRIAENEHQHYDIWNTHTGQDVAPDRLKVRWYVLIARLFGLTFGVKLMEQGEETAQDTYRRLREVVPEVDAILQDEERHENELIALIDEERLQYMGSVVLGLNDALVELTGALAGLTFALQHTKLVALTGLITGIAAAFSMASSEYLATKSENTSKNPVKASLYTGIAYIFTVALLILPFLLLPNIFVSLAVTLLLAVGIIG